MSLKLNVGDKAPSFELPNQDEKNISLESLEGQKLILFFYPKDNTPGCTKEACDLRDGYAELTGHGYTIIGISSDAPASHRKFIDKHGFQYDLLADTEKVMLNDYGVWGPKKFMGRTYDGVHRTTFILDETHTISHIITKVKTKEHTAQIIELLGL